MKRSLALLFLTALTLAGCQSAQKSRHTPAYARFFLESADDRALAVTLPQSSVTIFVGAKPVLTEFDVLDVGVAQVELGQCLWFQLTSAAARDLYRLTGANQGRRLVLAIDGHPLGARRIEQPFADGTILVFVELPDTMLLQLAARLKKFSADLHKRAPGQR